MSVLTVENHKKHRCLLRWHFTHVFVNLIQSRIEKFIVKLMLVLEWRYTLNQFPRSKILKCLLQTFMCQSPILVRVNVELLGEEDQLKSLMRWNAMIGSFTLNNVLKVVDQFISINIELLIFLKSHIFLLQRVNRIKNWW